MKRLIFGLSLLLLLFSCSKPVFNYPSIRDVEQVAGSNTGNVNISIPITVQWWHQSSSCDNFSRFEETRRANIIEIHTLGVMKGKICTADLGIRTEVYNFKATSAGVYELRFYKQDGTFITHVVTVN